MMANKRMQSVDYARLAGINQKSATGKITAPVLQILRAVERDSTDSSRKRDTVLSRKIVRKNYSTASDRASFTASTTDSGARVEGQREAGYG